MFQNKKISLRDLNLLNIHMAISSNIIAVVIFTSGLTPEFMFVFLHYWVVGSKLFRNFKVSSGAIHLLLESIWLYDLWPKLLADNHSGLETWPPTYFLSSNLNVVIPKYIFPFFFFPSNFGNNRGQLEPMYMTVSEERLQLNLQVEEQNAPAPNMGLIQPRWYHGMGRNKLWVT